MKKVILLSLCGLGVIDLVGCSNLIVHPDQSVGMVNTASACAKFGGKTVDGDVLEYQGPKCILPSVERVDKWAMFSRDHRSIQ